MIFSVLSFIFGLIIGSFLNSVIYRVNSGQKFIFGRSFCPRCQHQLATADLVPILSFLSLGGRCRYCQAKISIQYPLVELSTAFLFFFSTLLQGPNWSLLGTWFMMAILIVVFVSDLRFGIIPDKIVFPTVLILLFFRIASPFWQSLSRYLSLSLDRSGVGEILLSTNYWPTQLQVYFSPLLLTLLGSFLVSFFFLLLLVLTRGRGMGGGDVKLAFLLGLMMGFPTMFIGFFLAFLTGAIFATFLVFLRLKKWGQTIPLGPFLVLGTVLTLFWREQIFNWYLNFFQ